MDEQRVTAADRYRCVFLARFEVINSQTRTVTLRNYRIEVDPKGFAVSDIREYYSKPVVTETQGDLEVRVYEESAVDLTCSNLLGRCAPALDRCLGALEEEGYTVLS
ncbi:MAG: hypothetical protein NTW96_05680 [Planctomycetia bacterium]|nr:hypothetical protein [Planctomycetia bacterium]